MSLDIVNLPWLLLLFSQLITLSCSGDIKTFRQGRRMCMYVLPPIYGWSIKQRNRIHEMGGNFLDGNFLDGNFLEGGGFSRLEFDGWEFFQGGDEIFLELSFIYFLIFMLTSALIWSQEWYEILDLDNAMGSWYITNFKLFKLLHN